MAVAYDMQLPFGISNCDDETRTKRDAARYKYIYMNNTRFSTKALEEKRYLIVGQRGSGKTALTKYFHFQSEIPDAFYVDVDEKAFFRFAFEANSIYKEQNDFLQFERFMATWEFFVWSSTFEYIHAFYKYRDVPQQISRACVFASKNGSIADVLYSLVGSVSNKILGSDEWFRDIQKRITDVTFSSAKEEVIKLASINPIIIAIDTIEEYDIEDYGLMRAIAALIEFAANFNRMYSWLNIHIKIFIPYEVYPYLIDRYMRNTKKYVRHPVFLQWRPRELLRMICWRYYRYLSRTQHRDYLPKKVDWEDFDAVYKTMWEPFFGSDLVNTLGLRERTFPYILRHTQLRPRQIIDLCNSIAEEAAKDGSLPRFTQQSILKGVKKQEIEITSEIINDFKFVHNKVEGIIDAAKSLPPVFLGKDLDKVGKQTAALWKDSSSQSGSRRYDSYQFRRILAELGIVGVVRQGSLHSGYLVANFQFFLQNRLFIADEDQCVIHPVFYERFNTVAKFAEKFRVMPFPDHPSYNEVIDT